MDKGFSGDEIFAFRRFFGVYIRGMKALIIATVCGVVCGALGMKAYIYKRAPWMNDDLASPIVWTVIATGPGQIPILSDGAGQLYRVYVNTKDGGADWGIVRMPVSQ